MGLTFDLANPLAVVSEVTAGGLSDIAGVKVGDHLVRPPTCSRPKTKHACTRPESYKDGSLRTTTATIIWEQQDVGGVAEGSSDGRTLCWGNAGEVCRFSAVGDCCATSR